MSDNSDLLWNTASLPYDGVYTEVFINLERFLILFLQSNNSF